MIQVQYWSDITRLVIASDYMSGVVMVDIFPDIEKLKEKWHADCLLWSLTVDKPMRRQGLAKQLIEEAMLEAKLRGCKTMALEWEADEAPQWVYDWYTRIGFDEKVFGKGYALMVKEL